MTNAAAMGLRVGVPLGAATLAILVGSAAVQEPTLAIAACALPLVGALLVSPGARMLIVSGGALLVFQSSAEVSGTKSAYLGLYVVALTGAIGALLLRAVPNRRSPEHLLLATGTLFIALSAVSLIVSRMYGVPLTGWARDVFPYLMFGAAPLFAIDFARGLSRRVLMVTSVSVAAFATASFFLAWIDRRGTAVFDAERLGFSSFLLAASLVTLCAAHALWPGAQRYAWAALGAISFLALLATGTRSTLVTGVGVGVALLLAPTTPRARLAGGLALACAVLGLGVLGVKGGLVQNVVDFEATTQRLSTFTSAVADPASDQSLALRQAQTRAALALFEEAPLTGSGPGHPIEWNAGRGYFGRTFFVDSPAGFLAKFGLLGLTVLAFVCVLVVRFITITCARNGPSGLALIAFLSTVTVWSTLGTPFDDKGLSIAYTFLLALTIQEYWARDAQ